MSSRLHSQLVLILLAVCRPIKLRAATLIVQSNDPAIQYIGFWEHLSPNSTTTYAISNTTGSRATYSFTGTAISVFGVVFPPGPRGVAQVSEYSVDGNSTRQFIAPSNVTSPVDLRLYSAEMLANKQHTITILNQGEEFVVEHLEVTVDDTTSSSTEPKSSQVVAINPTAISTSSSQISTTTSAPSTTLSSSLSDTTVFSTTSSTIASDTTLTSSTTTPLSETSDTSVTQSQSIHPVSATISSTNIPTNEPETTEIAKNHSPTLTMGATIGVAAAGSFLLLLFLLAAAWWLYRKRIGGKRIDPSLSDDPQQLPPRTFATAGREHVPAIVPVARHRKGPSVYVSVGSSDDLFVGGSQDAFGHVPSSIIYPNEKNGPGIVPLYSPSSATSLLQQRSAYAYPTSTAHVLLGTPATVHRKDQSFVRRRSQDGGVRIAGGPPGHQSEDPGDTFLDMDSRRNTSYTLPPEYNFDSPAF